MFTLGTLANQISVAAGFAPGDISGLNLWLDASDASTITKDGSNLVSGWDDKGSQSNNSTQPVGTNKALWVDSALNSLPIIRFNGSDNYMSVANGANFNNANMSFFMVIKMNTKASWGVMFGNRDNGSGWQVGNYSNTGEMVIQSNQVGGNGRGTLDSTLGYAIFSYSYDGAARKAYENGALVESISDADGFTSNLSADPVIGARGPTPNSFMNIDIAEMIVYNSALSDTNRLALDAYLQAKWIKPFEPTDIAGLAVWYDADDASTITKDVSDKVSLWEDKSGNGNHAEQTTGLVKPEYVSSGINSNPSILFGSGANTYFSLGTIYLSSTQTIFTVFEEHPATNTFAIPYGGASGYYHGKAGSTIAMRASNQDDWTYTGDTDGKMMTLARSGAASTCRINGVELTIGQNGLTTTNFTITDLGRYTTNATFQFKGHLAEVIIYDSILSDTDRDAVEEYLTDKWSL